MAEHSGQLEKDISISPHNTCIDVTAFFLNGTLSATLADEIYELPLVTSAPRSAGLSVQQLPGPNGSCWRLWFGDGTSCCDYLISANLRTIWVRWNAYDRIADITRIFFDIVLAWTARLRGMLCLHASVPVIPGGAIAIVAPSGSGKSTLAAALASWTSGSILSDDVAVATPHDYHSGMHGHLVHPGRPHIRMDPASLAAIEYRGPAPMSYDSKYRISLDASQSVDCGLRFETTAQPLRALYFLRRNPGIKSPTITSCWLADAAGTIMSNLYPAQLPADPSRTIQEHRAIVQLLRDIPCRVLTVPDTLTALPMTCEVVRKDVATLDDSSRSGEYDLYTSVVM